MQGFLSGFQAWLAQPFNSNMSAARWAGFVGLMLVILIFWGFVLRKMEEV